MTKHYTHFGYETVPTETKNARVNSVFNSVADQYDLMNDLMSFGLHRLWKKIAVRRTLVQPDHLVLDLAGGTGDLTKELCKKVGAQGHIVLGDINNAMLKKGQERLLNNGTTKKVSFAQANAESIPFSDNTFDRIIIGFGLRNVTNKDKALKEMYRVLKPNSRMVILEFSEVTSEAIKSLYHTYSFSILPKLGQWICKDANSYKYLAESIRMHPNQEQLKNMLLAAGFQRSEYQNLHAGIVALHIGYKL